MTSRTQQGFTLIELMIVVAIIGILAAIAVPQYSTYLTRSKLVEGFVLSGSAVKAVVDYYSFHGRFPVDNNAAGLASPERLGAGYVQSISVDNGAIRIQYRSEVMGSEWSGEQAVLTLRPATVAGSDPSPHIHWICGLAEPVEGTVPLAAGETTIPAHFLPANCQ